MPASSILTQRRIEQSNPDRLRDPEEIRIANFERLKEAGRCAIDPVYFATKYAYVQNHNTGKVEKWQDWDYLVDVIHIILKYDVTYVLKASQIGLSWTMAILNVWYSLFNETAKCLLLSQGENEAKELLNKVRFVYNSLPDYFKLDYNRDSRTSLAIKNDSCEVMALASTEKAGHGFQGTLVTRDEVARHPYARENYKAVARSGAKMVELSTANKDDEDNYFGEKTKEYYYHPSTKMENLPSGVELYTNAEMLGTCMLFLPWNLRPVRVEGIELKDWWDRWIVSRYTKREIEEQFPSDIHDVFQPSVALSYFDYQSLDDMGYDVCNPIKQSEIDTMNGMIRIYKPPVPGRIYCLYTDPSNGVGDPFVTMVSDYITGEIVCSATGMEKIGHVAKIHDTIVRIYNNAWNSYEANAVGIAFEDRMIEFQTPSQAPRRKPDGKIDVEKHGQYVTGVAKQAWLGDLAGAISHRRFTVHDKEFTQQAKLVKRKGGDAVMDVHLTFDWVMCMMGLWQLNKYVPKNEATITSFIPNRDGKYVAVNRRPSNWQQLQRLKTLNHT